jgi:diacylglycerol kinase
VSDFLKSFQFAWRGVLFAWKGRNLRVQSGIGLAVVVLGLLLPISRFEWVVVSMMIGLVLSFEIMNTAIENIINFVSPEFHPLAGRIKDLAAAAVLILSIFSVAIGLLIFVPYLLPLIS